MNDNPFFLLLLASCVFYYFFFFSFHPPLSRLNILTLVNGAEYGVSSLKAAPLTKKTVGKWISAIKIRATISSLELVSIFVFHLQRVPLLLVTLVPLVRRYLLS